MERIVTFEGQDKAVYDLDALGGIMKLQSFYKVVRRAECH